MKAKIMSGHYCYWHYQYFPNWQLLTGPLTLLFVFQKLFVVICHRNATKYTQLLPYWYTFISLLTLKGGNLIILHNTSCFLWIVDCSYWKNFMFGRISPTLILLAFAVNNLHSVSEYICTWMHEWNTNQLNSCCIRVIIWHKLFYNSGHLFKAKNENILDGVSFYNIVVRCN